MFKCLKAWVAADLTADQKHRYRSKVSKVVKELSYRLFKVDADETDFSSLDDISDLPEHSANEDMRY